jgi:hypothetical protein
MMVQILLCIRRCCAPLALLVSFWPAWGQPACGSCPFPPCPCPCTLDEIAATIIPLAGTLAPDDVLTSGDGQIVLKKNQVLFVYTFTPSNQPTVTTYLPVKQFGNTGLYFYRLPDPNQSMGGWKPCLFWTSTADSTLPPYWAAYFKCNRLPYLSGSEVNQITQLFLPGCCCPPCR